MTAPRLSSALAAVLLAAAPAIALAPSAALAHGSTKPQHGGVTQMSGETLFELVTGPKGLDIYISEEDEPLAAKDYTAKLIVTAAGQKTSAALVATGPNKFTAAGLKPAKGAKIVVSLVEKSSSAKTFATFAL